LETTPAPIKPNNATLRAGNHGAGGAAPSNDTLHPPKKSEKNACLRLRRCKSCGSSSHDDDRLLHGIPATLKTHHLKT
jgi:hypothetical protein